ncbi:MAG: Gfo/Idh/MocA family protein [Candidatus Helarchaeota archaeon]
MVPVKFGIIGCGMAARFHLMAFKKVPDAKVKFVAAHDINEKAVKRFARAHKLEPHVKLEDMLQSDIDAVLISVPHYLHESITVAAAKAGKHVLCEKPMASTLEGCDEMISATKKAGVKFMIAENHRFLPAHVYMKELIDKDFIGEIFLARTYEGAFDEPENFLNPDIWNFTYEKGGGGVAMDQGVHKFGLLNWFLGEIDLAQCWLGKSYDSPPNKGEDNAMMFVRYKCGAMAEITVSSTSIHPPMNSTELHGTKGSLFEDHSLDEPVRVFSSHPEAEKKGQYYRPSIQHAPFPKYYIISAFHEDAHFAECILNDKEPEFTPEQAKEAVAGVLLCYLSAKNGRPTKMDELKKLAKTEGTKEILKGLPDVTQQNHEKLKWTWA